MFEYSDFFLFDANSSSAVKIGRIREIQAEGAVTLKQTGRICQADKLNLDPIRGWCFWKALLELRMMLGVRR